MKSHRIEFIVYFVGITLLGIAYYAIKHAVASPMFVIGVLAYLVALRALGRFLAKRLAAKEARGGSDV